MRATTRVTQRTRTACSSSARLSQARASAARESPSIGEQLRTYRLALITDPGYSDYFGGPPNVTPAKVTLMNRVDQVYEDDMASGSS